MNGFIKSEAGSVAVIVAISFTVLMGLTALVVDVGRLYVEQNRLVKAVDSAALAAAQELARSSTSVESTAKEYADYNGVNPDEIIVAVNGSEKMVTVEAVRKVEFTFAPFIGFTDSNVRARAKAKVGAISSVNGAVPFAVEKQNFVFGQPYVLKYGANSNFDHGDDDTIDGSGNRVGWYGALSLGGTGASRYEENLKNGFNGVLKVGQIVDTETGNVSGPTTVGIKFRLDNCTHTPRCSINQYSPACPTIIWVPVITPIISGNQVKQVEIVGFAAFLIEDIAGSGLNNYVKGYFIRETTSGEFGNSSDGYGLMAVKLIE